MFFQFMLKFHYMRKLLVANWKENPKSEREAMGLFRAVAKVKLSGVDVVVCPPVVYLEGVSRLYRGIPVAAKRSLALGVQDLFWEEQGAYTGEIGSGMVVSLGARYVILGHSERRKYAQETDAMINKKIKAVIKSGLNVILCVGESLAIRKKGMVAVERFIKNQLKKDLAGLVSVKNVIIAYEPIWAIGTGKNDSPQDALEMARCIKRIVRCRFLYGGSVNSKNVYDYVQYKSIDGALVGGASLKAGEFKKMINNIHG
jgi:triosephosphate isomerase